GGGKEGGGGDGGSGTSSAQRSACVERLSTYEVEAAERQVADDRADDGHRQPPRQELIEQPAAVVAVYGRDAERADRRERRDVHEVPAHVHRHRDADRVR